MAMTDLQAYKTRNPLFQQDLFLCVLDCLATPEADSKKFQEARPTLSSLARTCCAFSEPSLDRLWYKLDGLEPLIRCYAAKPSRERALVPTPSEWEIIHRYSHRIRELNFSAYISFLSLSFLRATSLRPAFLLPNLRVLRWHPYVLPKAYSEFFIIFIQRLLSPSLVSLSVWLSDVDEALLESFLVNYPLFCPNLKSIAINLGGHPTVSRTTVEVLSRAITHLEHLDRLDITVPIDDVALMHVALSRSLKRLALVLHPEESNLHQVFIPSDAIPFRYVEDLSLDTWDLHFVTSLLRTQDQKFRSFVLHHHSPPTIEAVNALFIALASHQRTHSIQSITLTPDPFTMMSRVDEFDTQLYVSHETFRPLSSFCNLRALVVDLTHWFSIDDDELISLARNWPSLQVLCLKCREPRNGFPWESGQYITLEGVLSLLVYCPDLIELCLPVDATKVPTDTRDIVCNPALTYLEFPQSPIDEAGPVQDFLTRYFPSVTEVCALFNQGSGLLVTLEYSLTWFKVNEYLQTVHYPDRASPDS